MQIRFLKKKIALAFILILAFIIGYIRETIFIIINTVINDYPFPYNASYVKPPTFLYSISTNHLITIKWLLTLFFSICFAGITLFLVNFYFKSKSFNKLTIITYSGLFLISLIISLISIIFNLFESFYGVSRFIAGLLQYPLLTLIMFTMFYFIQKLNND